MKAPFAFYFPMHPRLERAHRAQFRPNSEKRWSGLQSEQLLSSQTQSRSQLGHNFENPSESTQKPFSKQCTLAILKDGQAHSMAQK